MAQPANRIYPVQTFQLTGTQTSSAYFAPAGTEITVSLLKYGSQIVATGTLDWTASNTLAVQNGTATWNSAAVTYSKTTIPTGSTTTKVYQDCYVRLNSTAGVVTVTIDPNGTSISVVNNVVNPLAHVGGSAGAYSLVDPSGNTMLSPGNVTQLQRANSAVPIRFGASADPQVSGPIGSFGILAPLTPISFAANTLIPGSTHITIVSQYLKVGSSRTTSVGPVLGTSNSIADSQMVVKIDNGSSGDTFGALTQVITEIDIISATKYNAVSFMTAPNVQAANVNQFQVTSNFDTTAVNYINFAANPIGGSDTVALKGYQVLVFL